MCDIKEKVDKRTTEKGWQPTAPGSPAIVWVTEPTKPLVELTPDDVPPGADPYFFATDLVDPDKPSALSTPMLSQAHGFFVGSPTHNRGMMMTKDKVLFYLNRARRRAQCPDHEAMARAGIDYGERQRIARQQEEMKEEVEAWDIVMALLTSLDPGAFIER
jgi:hypothetical protein